MAQVEQLLNGMRRTKDGWSFKDLDALYIGLGFIMREGRKHCIYIHSKYPQLRATVARSRSLAKGYIHWALSLADKLEKLEADLLKTREKASIKPAKYAKSVCFIVIYLSMSWL